MIKEQIEKVVKFVRDHQPKFSTTETEHSRKIQNNSMYFTTLYNRRDELRKESQEYHDEMTKYYQEEAVRLYDTQNKAPE